MLPNFIHAGVPKAASGTFELIFRTHPEIFTTRAKEVNFFNNDHHYERGLKWYEDTYYSQASGQPVVCDLSIGYATGLGVDVPERVLESLGPEVKFLFILRHPADRAYSQYAMARYKGQIDTLPFPKAVERAMAMEGRFDRADVARVQAGSYHAGKRDLDIFRYCLYLHPGKFHTIISRYVELFGRERVLILFSDDIEADIQGEANKLFDFLGVARMPITGDTRRNESQTLKYPAVRRLANRLYALGLVRDILDRRLPPQTRSNLKRSFLARTYEKNASLPKAEPQALAALQAYYLAEIEKISALTGKDLSAWMMKYPTLAPEAV